jgi:cytochrome c551/c552
MQFKQFPMMMGRLARYTVDEVRHGNVWPLTYMMTIGTGFAGGAMALKDVAQARGGDENREAAVRDRSISTVMSREFGVDMDAGEADAFLGWYMQSMLQLGGLGFLAGIFHDAAMQVDNGAYGAQRIAGLVFGPSYSLIANDVFNVAAGIADANDDSNAKERAAARSIVGRIPMFGQVGAIKEALVDTIADEKM